MTTKNRLSILELMDSFRLHRHPLLGLLDELNGVFTAFFIDSGYFYYDEDG